MSLVMTDETGASISFESLLKHKENIQPLRQGRSVSQLNQILNIADIKDVHGLSQYNAMDGVDKHNDPSEQITGTTQQRAVKRRIEESHIYYEEQLNTYDGPDVLAVWGEYIDEIQTSTYASSTRAMVLPIIEAMINHICLTPKLLSAYANDQRFLKNCFLLCESVTDPLRIYRFLQGKGIGQNEAKFYLNYSSLLYVKQHYRSTIEVLYSAIKSKVEPTAHLRNRYKYIIECEKQRLEKIMGEPIDDRKFQQLVKAKDPQTIGKYYSFSYDSHHDNILNQGTHNNSSTVGLNSKLAPDGTVIQRGLSVIYKDGYRPPTPQEKSEDIAHTDNDDDNNLNHHKANKNRNSNCQSSEGGIYLDSDDEDGHLTDQRALYLMSPDVKRHARLATMRGKAKENQQPYTSDFSLAHDNHFIQDLDEYNNAKGIQATPIDVTAFELPTSHITAGIYCDDENE